MKNFDEIYNKLYDEKNEELEELRRLKEPNKIAILILFLISFFILPPFGPILVLSAYITSKKRRKGYIKPAYREAFKNEVIATLVKECDENLSYSPHERIGDFSYYEGEFEDGDYKYYSEDLIYGKLEKEYILKIAEVTTEYEITDAHDNTKTITSFNGMFGVVQCPKMLSDYIKIHSDKDKYNKKKLFKRTSKDKIEMDSEEFEKEFDVFGTDKIKVMQILTADIMEMLIDFKQQSNIPYELTIKGKKIYIRFHTRRNV